MGVHKRILAIAVVCIFLLASFAGCLDNPEIDDEPVREIQFEEIDVYPIEIQGEKAWVVEMVVSEVDFEGIEEVRWDDIEVSFHNDGGVVGGNYVPLTESRVPSDSGWWYYPVESGSEVVSLGDTLILYGLQDRQMESVFSLRWGIEMTFDRPKVFEMVLGSVDEPDISVSLSEPVLDSIIFPGSTSYTYEAEVTDIDPANATLNWWTLQLRIESPTDAFGDFFGPLIEDPGVEGYDGEDGPPEIEFWYIDDPLGGTNGSGTPTAMDEGDSVKITGLSETFEGGIVTLLKGEDPISTSDPIPEMPEPNIVLELDTPSIHHIDRNDTALWNVSIPISDVDPDDLIRWDSVWVRVWDAEEVYMYDREVYNQDPGNYSDSISVYWNDDGPQDEVISIGDNIVIKGLNLTFQGGQVEIYRGLTLLDSIRLPSQWPVDHIWISTSSTALTNRTVGNEKYWDYTFNITSVYPDSLVIPWDDIEIRIVDQGTDEVLIPLTHPELFENEHRTVPTIFYYEGGTPDGVDHKDIIILSGLNLTFEDKYLEIYFDGELIGKNWLREPFEPGPPELMLSTPSVSDYDVNGTSFFQIVININKITPKWIKIPWTDLQVRILNSTGYELVPNSSVSLDPQVYDLDDTDGIDIGLYYVDIAYDGKLGAGDALKFTGLTEAFKAAIVEFYYNGELIGTSVLASDFP